MGRPTPFADSGRATQGVASELFRLWQAGPETPRADAALPAELEAAVAAEPGSAERLCALAWVQANLRRGWPREAAQAVLPLYRQAWAADPTHVVAGLNAAEALLELGRHEEGAEQARQTLAALEALGDLPDAVLEAGHYPPEFDHFRVGWELAAWRHAGDRAAEGQAKRRLLTWRLHLILGDLTNDVDHFQAAADAGPDLPVSWASLGCALARHGRIAEAVPHLERAVAGNPFDCAAARALYQALGMAGKRAEQAAFAEARRKLAQAAPQFVQPEPWFAAHVGQPFQADVGDGRPGQADPRRQFPQLSLDELHCIFGQIDTSRAHCGYTVQRDAHVVLTLLAHARPRRILEIGTAAGHMTANLTEWSPDDAHVFSLGAVAEMATGAPAPQRPEDPPRTAFGAQANHFGKGHKVFLIVADSLGYDFGRLAPLDFAFIDGAHDLAHVRSDSLKVYDAMSQGGYLVWHDFGSATPWVEVRQALEQLPFAEPIYHVAGTEVAFLRKGQALPEAAPSPATPLPRWREGRPRSAPLAIVWQGDVQHLHSLALANRAFCQGLIERGHELSILSETRVEAERVPVAPCITERLQQPLARPADVHIRQGWPPDFTPPPAGHWVFMQPWEFGSLPREWLGPLLESVDEVWACSRYVRDVYVESGVPAERVHVVPLGVDVERFRADRPPYPLRTAKRFKFLFVGGTIGRKGIDVLLNAYTRAFRRGDDVCLVIKDMGVGTFYRGQTAEARIAEIQADADAPEIEYLDGAMSDDDLAGLYTACSCLVHPYRGEGFGLPIAEAMASGVPAIVTGLGAALDFCTAENAYLIPAQKRYFPDKRLGDLETVGLPWLAEPDETALVELMRYAVAHPEEVRQRGEAAAAHIRAHFTWQHAVAAAEARLFAPRGQPVRRLRPVSPRPSGGEGLGVRGERVPGPPPHPQPLSPGWARGEDGPSPHPQPLSPGGARGGRVSLCMIVRNEERHLAACLQSVRDLVDEIIIVDTGSTDRTKEIAASFGAKVVDFAWVDSFAAARNESLRHTTGDWIFWLDADERLDAVNRERLGRLLARLGTENVAYFMRQSSPLEHGPHVRAHVDHPRLFPNRRGLAWRYRVHEQILLGLRELGADAQATDIVIEHAGFAEADRQGAKVERNLRLLHMELAERPDDTFVLYNLGAVALTQGRLAEAIDYFQKCVAKAAPGEGLLAKVHALLSRCHQQEGRRDLAVQWCRRGRAAFPADAELLFIDATLRQEQGDLAGAEQCLRQLVALPRTINLSSADSSMQGYRAHQLIAEICAAQGRLDAAAAAARQAVADCPGFIPALRLLADCQRALGQWSDLEGTLEELRQAGDGMQADLVQARAHLARREFALARCLLKPLIAQVPQAIWPKVILSYVLLQQDRDRAAAEAVLRDILAIDPNHTEARHNLQVLLNARPAVNGNAAHSRSRFSVCMMVKNEEKNLPRSLGPAIDLFDEAIVVDTGSTDRTREIATALGARVFEFPWVDSFAAARNECLRHATGDWIFWMDGDDQLDEENRAKLRRLFDVLRDENAAYIMRCRCLPDPATQVTTEVHHLRLFRNRADVRWDFRVHEQILPAVRDSGADVRSVDIVIHHTGYRDPALRAAKLERDLRLLLMENAERPDHPFILFNLGQIYQEQGRHADALPLFRRSLELSDPGSTIVRKLYALIVQCANQLGRSQEALAVCRQAMAQFPEDVEIRFQEGATLERLGDREGAARCWEEVLRMPAGNYVTSMNIGVRSYMTRHNLAVVYQDAGRIDEAIAQWQAALQENPDYQPAWHDLGIRLIERQRWSEVEGLAQRIESRPHGRLAGALLRGRALLARREFTAAQALLTALAAEFATAIEPRLLLSDAYLQEGRDRAAAERALRAVLALDPKHAQALHNLAVLCRE